MPTARKAPAKKAPAKRAPTRASQPRTRAQPPVEPAETATDTTAAEPEREQHIEAFENLRARARLTTGLTIGPKTARIVTLGKDEGFDPPLVAKEPTTLAGRSMLDIVSRRSDVLGMLNILIGPRELLRVAGLFDQFDDGDRLMAGLALRLLDGVYGTGAGDVPGGTPASSTP